MTSGVVTATRASVPGAYVGTSGWSYPTWRGGFYPSDARPKDFLHHYAERLTSVELNTSAYQLPSEEHFTGWAEQVPAGFRFAVRMPRLITHASRLGLVSTFCERARLLGDKLGPVLVVLDRKRDDGFLMLLRDSLDPDLEVAFDFRHESWAGAQVPVRVFIVSVVFPSMKSPSLANATSAKGAMSVMLSPAVNVGSLAVPPTVDVPLWTIHPVTGMLAA